jgi:hypothetical protein
MISWVELRLACRGLLLLARFDKQFLRYFDRSATGALRSFRLALVLLPVAWVMYWLDIDPSVPNTAVYLVARTVGYAYSWILFPMVILSVARLFDRDAEAPGCVAIYNWLSLLWVTLQIPISLLFAIYPNSGAAAVLSIAALLYSALVEGFFLIHAFRIHAWQAAILVIIDVALSIYVITPGAHALGLAPLP